MHNAGGSQIAAAFFNPYAGPGCRAISAGIAPAERVQEEVAHIMREIGVDPGGSVPRKRTAGLAREADVLVTMGCGENYPLVPGLKIIDWAIPDPNGQLGEDDPSDPGSDLPTGPKLDQG